MDQQQPALRAYSDARTVAQQVIHDYGISSTEAQGALHAATEAVHTARAAGVSDHDLRTA
jgi:hypothetical protein